MKKFNELPQEIQEQVKRTLRAYDEETVWFENGMYTYGVAIQSKYAHDHEYIGTYYAKDVYTEEERFINYCEEFHSYPIEYRGNRDYNIIKDYKAKYKMVDGNIVRA